jgi:hypothetical protein
LEAQKQKVFATRAEYQTKIEDLRKQILDLERKEHKDLQKILTEAQKARLREVLAERSGTPSKDDKNPESKSGTDSKKP